MKTLSIAHSLNTGYRGGYTIRPLCPSDKDRMLAFFSSHTSDTILSRYGYALSYMSAEKASRLVNVDQCRNVALGAFSHDHGGEEVLDAVARYYTTSNTEIAEFAVVVKETARRRGLARLLFARLCEIAAAHGVKKLWAQVSVENHIMRAFISNFVHETHFIPDLGIIHYYLPTASIDLHQTPTPAPTNSPDPVINLKNSQLHPSL